MRVVVAGGSGFLGTPLRRELAAAGHEVTQLVRRPAVEPDQWQWDPEAGQVTLPEDTGAVVNLCGAGIGHRWTKSYKALIRSSRIVPTTRLAQSVARQDIPLFVSSSGVGFYGETGDRIVDEGSGPGDDFLARLAVDWEAATRPAREAGSRVVLLRTGLPLDKDGGFLKPQLLPFRLGIGGRLGSGRQWIPWIALKDWLRAAMFVMSKDIEGPVNVAGPEPVTNAELTKALAKALHRPAIFPVPKLGVRIVFGEYAAEEGWRSLRVMPKVLRDNGFEYEYPTFTSALGEALR